MKHLKLLSSLFFILSVVTSCEAGIPHTTKWFENGQVVSASGEKIQLDLQSVYDGLEFQNKTYVVGFRIDSDGINIPQIAEISADLKEVNYWAFDSIINDIFVYQQSIYANNIDGKVFGLENKSWKEAHLIFPENSQVVFGDGKEKLIICHSTSLPKSAKHNSGCYSLSPAWKFQFTWFELTPEVCNNKLYIYENQVSRGIFSVLSLETGEVLYSEALAKIPSALCDIKQKLPAQ